MYLDQVALTVPVLTNLTAFARALPSTASIAATGSTNWQFGANVRYEAGLSPTLMAFVASQLNYRTRTFAAIGGTFGSGPTLAPGFEIKRYATLDAQLGVRSSRTWRAVIWGKNLTNSYYWMNLVAGQDQLIRDAQSQSPSARRWASLSDHGRQPHRGTLV